MSYYTEEDPKKWAPWFLGLWGVVAGTLFALWFFLPFVWWAGAAAVGFGGMETAGMWRHRDHMPPLTYAIRRYVPMWLAFSLFFGMAGLFIAELSGANRPYTIAGLTGFLGWLVAHFSKTYQV